MSRPASLHRLTTAACLVAAAALSVLYVLTAPLAGPDMEAYLARIADAGPSAAISVQAYLWSQPALAIGVLGVAFILRTRTPILAPISAALVVLGTFGHAAYAGIGLLQVTAAADADAHGPAAPVFESAIGGVAAPAALIGAGGTVLGVILLGIALMRVRGGFGWIGIVLVAWVLVEFAGTGLTEWAKVPSGVLLAVGFTSLAIRIGRSDLREWLRLVEAESPTPADGPDAPDTASAREEARTD
jgi:hypothetical protein